MKIENLNKKNKKALINIICGTFLFLLFFALLFMLRNRMHFNSDEYDNILGGTVIANGGEIYKDFVSQHTPMMYYLCALFYLIGARSVMVFRLMFFAVMSLIWVFMFFRYKKAFGKTAMLVYPVSYITLMFTADNVSHCILSEQIQSQALVVLLLEYLLYGRIKNLKISNCICISLSVLFSFGTAFVSVYPIFVIGIGVLINEIYKLAKNKKSGNPLAPEFKKLFLKGSILIIICLIPFIVIIAGYILKGNLQNAIFGIYTVNRTYYPAYGGAPASILKSFFNPLGVFRATLANTNIYFLNISLISAGLFSLILFLRKRILKSFVCLGFIYMCAMRAMIGFHGLPFLSVGMIFFAFCVQALFDSAIDFRKSDLSGIKKYLFSFLAFSIIMFPSFITFAKALKSGEMNFTKAELHSTYKKGSLEDVINVTTDKTDKIYDGTITLVYVTSDRLPISAPGLVCPWIYDAYHDKIFDALSDEKPKLIYLPDTFDVWGHKSDQFAKEAYNFIQKRYTAFESECGINGVYIRNDYYKEAFLKWKAHNKS